MLVSPLQNKTVLITKPGNSETFANQIKQLGGIPIVFPLIELKSINEDLLNKQLNTQVFDWIIFTSPQAVRFFFEKDKIPLNNIKIAAVGNSTQKVLEEHSVEVNFVPTKYTAKQLALEIPVEENQHVFIPRSDLAKNDIVEVLKKRKCKVTVLSIYYNSAMDYSLKEIENINNDKVDFIVFTSGSAVQSFVKNKLGAINSKVVCIGPETAKVAKSLNINVARIAKTFNLEGVINSILDIMKNE